MKKGLSEWNQLSVWKYVSIMYFHWKMLFAYPKLKSKLL